MTKYTFNLNSNKNNNSNCPFYNKCKKSTDYSKMLDDFILADLKEKNPWLYGNSSKTITNTCPFIDNTDTIKIKINTSTIGNDLESAFLFGGKTYNLSDAYKFLANLGNTCPFKKNTTYKLSNGSIMEITDDYIHIDEKMYFFNLMDDTFFFNLNNDLKKTIATIYIDGLKITIKK